MKLFQDHVKYVIGCWTCPVWIYSNVRGEPVFSVMAAGWFCEKSSWFGKVEDVKPVFLEEEKKTDFNRQLFWGGGFLPG